ncbi:MAG: hypothetical protein OZSIB_4115 [Candidatus Ozemobacter sibiricus]|jgi:anti-sigma factor RsiW|uniref:Putative zinc-finger domain-containing protein n=1 Tax=Candidatus Ozemobacter sibiricus TaxID=2268124 RepID=A0A367ZNF0_9BACT|nr:MAG: hypothetical protein OZSIB_4115 [Candidatus Ozemobacter sibiricus]
MNCEHWRDLILTDHLDGEIAPADREALNAHVAVCPACRELMEQAPAALIEPFARLERVAPPPAVWEKIAVEMGIDPSVGREDPAPPPPSLEPTEPGPSGCGPWLLAGAVAAGFILVAAVAFWLMIWAWPAPPVVPPPTVTLPGVATPSQVSPARPVVEPVPVDGSASAGISSSAELFDAERTSK